MTEDVSVYAERNHLLAAMPPSSRKRLYRRLEPVELEFESVLCEPGDPMQHVYFPAGAFLSLLTVLDNGIGIETAVIGTEGAFGIFLPPSRICPVKCIVQLSGPLVRCPAKTLQDEIGRSATIRELIFGYGSALLAQTQQMSACNTLHSVGQRMGRMLLMMQDRADGRVLPYTQEFLSTILGANRKSVTLAAQSLQHSGAISYQRGALKILDRSKLEAACCECYGLDSKRLKAFTARADALS